MTASSNERSDALANLDLKQIEFLLRALSQLTMRQRRLVEAYYTESAPNFGSTLQFLTNIGWIREEEGVLSLTKGGYEASQLNANVDDIRPKLVQTMIEKNSPYRKVFASYFNKFKDANGDFLYHPSFLDRIRESNVRNFVMELGLVTYRSVDGAYVLEGNGVDLHIWSAVERSVSRKQFQAKTEKKTELGFQAELAVLDYEKTRVGSDWASRVEHISATKPFACYDIKSISTENGRVLDRYIEVKAGAPDVHRFYWSATEMEAARALRLKYFLYLLPAFGANDFDLKKMLIVQDPIVSVYENHEEWEIEENVILCKQKQ